MSLPKVLKYCCKDLSSIGISLGAVGIVCQLLEMTLNFAYSLWNFYNIFLNILWIYGICIKNSTLMLPLVIAEGFFLCLLCVHCFPAWLIAKIQQLQNIQGEEYLNVLIIPLINKLTSILVLLFVWILKFSLYKSIKPNNFEYIV